MQTNDLKRQVASFRDFKISRGRFLAERKMWKDAFSITHRGLFVVHNFPSTPLQGHSLRDNRASAQFRKSFFSAKSIAQLIAEQGVAPVQDIGLLAGAIPDDDLDEFVNDIYQARQD